MQGSVISINISKQKGTSKIPVNQARLKEGFGIINDAHSGDTARQVSLLTIEEITAYELNPGDFAENITTRDIDLSKIKVGDKIRVSGCVLEVSQIGKSCHSQCDIKKKIGSCIMPKQGIFTKVLKGGTIKVGDSISL